MLPHFQEAEGTNTSPFLDYPIWKENWNLHLEDYEPKSRSIMLLNHLDKEAKRRIAGKECDYEGAIAKLDSYYGDTMKIVRDCLAEVQSFPRVKAGDYKGLVKLQSCIEVNFAQLSSCGMANELSNIQGMRLVESKFPETQLLEWTKELQSLPDLRRRQAFPELIKWLDSEGCVWTAMELKDINTIIARPW